MGIPHSDNSVHCRYLMASDHDLLWGLTVNTAGTQTVEAGMHYPPPNHPVRYLFTPEKGRVLDEYQLLYLTQGEGTFRSHSCNQGHVKAGQMFLLFPGEWHSYAPDPQYGWKEYWIGFKGKNIDERVENGFFSPRKPLFHVGVRDEIVQLYNQAIFAAQQQKTGYQQLMAGIVNHLLGLARSLDRHLNFEELNVVEQINRAKVFFSENLHKPLKMEDVAAELNIGYSWFRRLFREYTGFSPARYVLELKLQRAKELLTNTNMRINEIAFECGFDNTEYFFAVFKKKTGCTPTAYRGLTQASFRATR